MKFNKKYDKIKNKLKVITNRSEYRADKKECHIFFSLPPFWLQINENNWIIKLVFLSLRKLAILLSLNQINNLFS